MLVGDGRIQEEGRVGEGKWKVRRKGMWFTGAVKPSA